MTSAAEAAPPLVLAGRSLQLLALGLEHILEAVLGEVDAGGAPEISGARRLTHVTDDAAQRQRAAGPSDDVGMHCERNVFRGPRAALGPHLVEIRLPGLEPVMRVAVFAVAVPEQRAVAERLPRQLDHHLAVLLPKVRQLVME